MNTPHDITGKELVPVTKGKELVVFEERTIDKFRNIPIFEGLCILVAGILFIETPTEVIEDTVTRITAVIECDPNLPYIEQAHTRIKCYTPGGEGKYKTPEVPLVPNYKIIPEFMRGYSISQKGYDSEIVVIGGWGDITYKGRNSAYFYENTKCNGEVVSKKIWNWDWSGDRTTQVDSCLSE